MDAELKTKWIAALRSGEFEQAHGSLKDGNAYCCLGVLCVLNGIGFDEHDHVTLPGWDGSYEKLLPLSQDQARELWPRNDGANGYQQHSFVEIADYIEKNIS